MAIFLHFHANLHLRLGWPLRFFFNDSVKTFITLRKTHKAKKRIVFFLQEQGTEAVFCYLDGPDDTYLLGL